MVNPDLTRTTVNLTAASIAALAKVEQLAPEDSRTTTINRAIQAYALLAELGEHQGNYRLDLDVGGRTLYVAAGRATPTGRWRPW